VVILDQLNEHIKELCDITSIPWDNSPRNIKRMNETMAYYRPKFFSISCLCPSLDKVNATSTRRNVAFTYTK